MNLYTATFFWILINIIASIMPTAKATVTEVYVEKHLTKSTFRLRTRVTDKNKSWDNRTVVSGYIYNDKTAALADKNVFRWFYSSRGSEQPKKPKDIWFENSPRLDDSSKAVVQFVDNMAQVDLDGNALGNPS